MEGSFLRNFFFLASGVLVVFLTFIFFSLWKQHQGSVEKLAIACNKKKSFNSSVMDAMPEAYKAGAVNCKFRFTNLNNKQTCHGGESPESVYFEHFTLV